MTARPKPKKQPEPMWNLQGGTWKDPWPKPELDAESEAMVLRMLANTFGQVAIERDEGWEWVTDGKRDPRHQRIGELFAVQVTHEGKSWIWAHRTRKGAVAMADSMKKLKVKNVRTWHGKIEWEAV